MVYVFLDIETTGTNPDIHEMIEVGYVTEAGAEVGFSLPFDEAVADPEALEVNGWGKREFAPVITYKAAIERLSRDLKDAYVVGQQIHFDMGFMREFFKAMHVEPVWNFRSVELSSLVAGALGIIPPMSSGQITEFTGVVNNGKHSALEDAKWNKRVFDWWKDLV